MSFHGAKIVREKNKNDRRDSFSSSNLDHFGNLSEKEIFLP